MKSNKFLLIALGVVTLLIVLGVAAETVHAPVTSEPVGTSQLSKSSYALFGDVFSLQDGQATLQGHGFSVTSTPLIPMGYSLATSSTGTISMEGKRGSAVVLYREFGANLNWVTLFVFDDASPTPHQIASTVAYEGDSKVESVSVANGVVTLKLLVVSQADLQKPHYAQTPTEPKTLKFAVNGYWLTALQ